ncbi:hypothetical protein ARMSODRAFT_917744 [Armillaria solidipes]|uniref:Uncharacterized protein n=1 Tax=Armillaria solidipes TaxID=1076256 RepID=A0A2H3B8Z0_9AGAR|nr:hypothetical protein ARMSODRAFT_917744 [Armillaria solidipes]
MRQHARISSNHARPSRVKSHLLLYTHFIMTHPVPVPKIGRSVLPTILSSLDGALYCLSLPILRRSTTSFVSSSFTFGPDSKPIPIHEYDIVLKRLLRIIGALAIPPWRTFDDLEGVLSLAEAWEARAALDILRASITSPVFLREPLRVYAIAITVRSEEEAEFASKYTPALSLHDKKNQETSHRISMRSLVKWRDEFWERM